MISRRIILLFLRTKTRLFWLMSKHSSFKLKKTKSILIGAKRRLVSLITWRGKCKVVGLETNRVRFTQLDREMASFPDKLAVEKLLGAKEFKNFENIGRWSISRPKSSYLERCKRWRIIHYKFKIKRTRFLNVFRDKLSSFYKDGFGDDMHVSNTLSATIRLMDFKDLKIKKAKLRENR